MRGGGPDGCAGSSLDGRTGAQVVVLSGRAARTHHRGRGLIPGVQSASPMVRPRRAGPVARPVRGVCVLGRWGGVWGEAAFGVEDVLCDRGLRSPPGHWGLTAVTWRRSTFPADIAVLDADRLAPGAGVRRGLVAARGGQGVDVLLRLYDGCLHLAIWAGAD